MKNQRYSYSPTLKHTKKRNNFPEKDGHYYADLFFTQGTLINPPSIEQSDSPEKDFEDQTVDTELIAKIFGSPKSKTQHSPQYARNEKELEKRRKLKLKKKEQTIACERLSSPKPRSSFQSPLFSEKKPKKFVSPFQANKEFIISRFYGVEEQITQRQLETILHYFTIIDKNINEKPLVVKYILPLCQIENSNDEKLFDSQKLKDILFQSFQKASTNSFWKDISNCITSARMNGKKTFIRRVSTPQKIRPNMPSNNKSDDNLGYYSRSSDDEYSASPLLDKYYEEIDEEQKQRKQKLNPITEEMSDTMIDEECNFVASNNSYNELFQKQKTRVKSPMKTNQLEDQENDSNETQERSEEEKTDSNETQERSDEEETDSNETQEKCEEEETGNYESQERSEEEEEKVDNNELNERSEEEENSFILNIDDSFASYSSNKKDEDDDLYDAKERDTKGTLIRNFNNVEIYNYEEDCNDNDNGNEDDEDGNELYTEEEFQNLIHEMTDSENEEEAARSPSKQAKPTIRTSHSRRKNQSDSSTSNPHFFKQLKVIEKAQNDSPVSRLRRIDDDDDNWIRREWNQSLREAGYTNDKIGMDSLTYQIKELKTQNSQLKSDNSKLMTNYRCLKNSNMKLKTDNQQLKTKNEELTKMTRQMKKLKSDKIMLENDNKKLKSDNFKLSTNNKQLQDDNIQLTTTNEKLKKPKIETKEKIQELSQKVEQLTAENSQLKDDNFHLENANFKLKSKNQNLKIVVKEIEELRNQNNYLANDNEQYKLINHELSKDNVQILTLSRQLEKLKAENEHLKRENKQIERTNNKIMNENQQLEKNKKKKQIKNNDNDMLDEKTEISISDGGQNDEPLDDDDENFIIDQKVLNKGKTVNGFNSLPLKAQQLVISNQKTAKKNQFLVNLNDLILYLLQFSQMKGKQLIEISTDDSSCKLLNCNENTPIQFNSKATEILFNNESLESDDFLSKLKDFKNTVIEIRYPSKSFQKIFNSIVKLKRTNQISIQIFISKIKAIGEKFNENENIDIIRFDSSVNIIQSNNNVGPFNGCSSLKKVFFDENSSLKTISNHSFEKCSLLTEITIPSSVNSIEDHAFEDCSSLVKVLFEKPATITYIGSYAFKGCSSLERIEIPSSVIKFGLYVFFGCSSLKYISLPPSINRYNIGLENDIEVTKS
ncbi:beta-1,3-glucan linked protein [Tritrichomonas musculus]|uniref:Beta-1,3-glucan linked protein n=1 Tax=Tritrichomonas musculus TaxID=1915356 RepID=A0ABR2L1I2_9EUKA